MNWLSGAGVLLGWQACHCTLSGTSDGVVLVFRLQVSGVRLQVSVKLRPGTKTGHAGSGTEWAYLSRPPP